MVAPQSIRAFFKSALLGIILVGFLACHRPSSEKSSDFSLTRTPARPAEIEATPIVYNESELLRGRIIISREGGKTSCPSVLVTKSLVVLPRTCEISESENYNLQLVNPKTNELIHTTSRLAPVAINSLSQTIHAQSHEYLLIYEVQTQLPDWVQPIRLLPPNEVSSAFGNEKSLIILTTNGINTIKSIDVKVERYYIYPYVTQKLPPENLLLAVLAGRLYLAGSAKLVGQEMFWINLSSFNLIQELLAQP